MEPVLCSVAEEVHSLRTADKDWKETPTGFQGDPSTVDWKIFACIFFAEEIFVRLISEAWQKIERTFYA